MKSPGLDHETVRELLRTAAPDRILRLIGKSHPADIALLFKDLEAGEVRILFDILLSVRRAAKTLKELPPDLLPDILALIEDEKLARLMVWADPDDEVTFIDSLPEERREKVLALMDPDRRARVKHLTSYPEGTVGRIMTTDYLALSPDTTAQGAIDKIRERGELEAFFYLYAVDEGGKLVGVVPIRNLVIAPQDRTLGEIMIDDPIRADVWMDQEEAARLVSKYELLALPIVDRDGRIMSGGSPFTKLRRQVLRSAAARAATGESGVVRAGGSFSTQEVVAYTPVAGGGPGGELGWSVVTARNVKTASLPQSEARREAVVAGVVVALLGTGLMAWLWLVVIRPTLRLQREAERIAYGDLSKPVEIIRYDEIGLASRALERIRVLLIRRRSQGESSDPS